MIKKILGTTFSRIIITLGGIIVLLLNTRYLGAQKLGELSLLLVAINLILQVSEFVGGSSLVYLQKKHQTNQLLSVSYIWSFLVSVIALFILHFFYTEIKFTMIIIGCALIQSINHTHLHLLVGKEKIKGYNISSMVQMILVVSLILFYYLIQDSTNISTYLTIYFFGQVLTLLFSSFYLKSNIKTGGDFGFNIPLIKDVYHYGFLIQLTNLFQFGVYRINYVVLESFTSFATLGIFSLGTQFSEKALIPSNAISLIQYSNISNSTSKTKAAILTIHLLTFSFIIGLVSTIALIIIPESFIILIFGEEFVSVKSLLIYLAPGVLFMSISAIYSHYFAGLAKYKFNTITSFTGIILMTLMSYLLIPKYGILGAGMATSFVYFFQMIIQMFFFKHESKLTWNSIRQIHIEGFSKISISTLKNWIK